MASSLDGAATTLYLTYTISSAFTTSTEGPLHASTVTTAEGLPGTVVTIYEVASTVAIPGGSTVLTIYKTGAAHLNSTETLSTAINTVTTETVISLASSSPTTSTNTAFDPSPSTMTDEPFAGASTTFEPSASTSIASSGLSSGAKAGIGVEVAVVSLIIAAFVAGCLIVRRRRRRQSPLSEVVSPAQEAGYHKPELDATEIPRPSDRGPGGGRPEKPELEANLAQQSHVGVQDHRAELDGAPKPRTDGRAELDGRMVSDNGKIT